MTMTADQIVDRRRLRRKLSFWRVVAFLAVVIVLIAAAMFASGREVFPGLAEAQIARVTVNGFITEDRARTRLLEKLAENDSVKAVIVSIDSTGGATAGGEGLYEALLKLSTAKPTVATVGTFGASAAYMAAIATDHIVARRTSITGSIGVLFQYPEISELLDKLGVQVEEIKSAPLKAAPSPFRPATPAARAIVAGIVRDSFNWFVDIVAERRELERSDALVLADGRIYTGQQALAANLIDEIGGEDAAVAWLAAEKGIDADLPVRDWQPKQESSGLFSFADAAVLWLAQQTGIAPDILGGGVLDRFLPKSLKLDGLLSVWQGPGGGDSGPAEGAAQ
jgi:protease-4